MPYTLFELLPTCKAVQLTNYKINNHKYIWQVVWKFAIATIYCNGAKCDFGKLQVFILNLILVYLYITFLDCLRPNYILLLLLLLYRRDHQSSPLPSIVYTIHNSNNYNFIHSRVSFYTIYQLSCAFTHRIKLRV